MSKKKFATFAVDPQEGGRQKIPQDELKATTATAILAAVRANGNSIEANQINQWLSELIGYGYLQRVDYFDRNDKYQVDFVLTAKGQDRLKKMSRSMLEASAL